MHMTDTITITRKGQTTLPVEFRRRLGLDKAGGTLQINFDERNNELTIKRAVTPAELSEKFSKYLKKDIPPLQNVDEYYQKNRRIRVK